jgi:glucose-6-phosphate 1-epimerase
VRIAEETDQVHLNTRSTCVVHDSAWNRRIIIEKKGSDSTVLWNPWIDKTASMSDMAAESSQEMICIETANAADNAIQLAPGTVHKLSARIRVD